MSGFLDVSQELVLWSAGCSIAGFVQFQQHAKEELPTDSSKLSGFFSYTDIAADHSTPFKLGSSWMSPIVIKTDSPQVGRVFNLRLEKSSWIFDRTLWGRVHAIWGRSRPCLTSLPPFFCFFSFFSSVEEATEITPGFFPTWRFFFKRTHRWFLGDDWATDWCGCVHFQGMSMELPFARVHPQAWQSPNTRCTGLCDRIHFCQMW